MGSTQWSDEQKKVISARNTNVLVSAAAGSGKTSVLVERIFSMITENDGCDIDRLLIMTFTNAAAAEMKERIRTRIAKALEENPKDKRLLRQQMLLHNAWIVTIDSFCIRLVREFFYLADIDPAFRIGDSSELELIKGDVVASVLEECYEKMDDNFAEAVEIFGNKRGDKKIENTILSLYNAASASSEPVEWLEIQKRKFDIESNTALEEIAWVQEIMAHTGELLKEAVRCLELALNYCSMSGGPDYYSEILSSELAQAKVALNAQTYKERREATAACTFNTMPRKKVSGDYDPSIQERAAALRNRAKQLIADELKAGLLVQSESTVRESIMAMKGPMLALLDAAESFAEKLLEAKKEKNTYDFNDTERFAYRILKGTKEGEELSPATVELRKRFKEVFIDEYQDSSMIQEDIAKALTCEKGVAPYLFTVGDVKQSIYRFRLAKPSLFLERQAAYSKNPEEGLNINLDKNFRSYPLVLDSVNDVFRLCMRGIPGGIVYGDEEALKAGRSISPEENTDYRTRLILINTSGNNRSGDAWSDFSDPDADVADVAEEVSPEAAVVISEIRKLMSEGFMVETKNGKRPLRYSDIAVLQRTNSESEAFLKEFAKAGIPTCALGRGSLFDSYEIRTLLEFLKLLDNPRQDIVLAGVLHSKLFGFSSEEMAIIRSSSGFECSMYDAVRKYTAEGPEDELRQKLVRFIGVYNEVRSMSLVRDIDRLIAAVCEKTGFTDYCRTLPNGSRRLMNIELLLEAAAEYEAGSYSGLFSFVRYVDTLREKGLGESEASAASSADAVIFTTMHKSKGLEFPVVFVTGLMRRMEEKDGKGDIVVNSDCGIAVNYIDNRLRVKQTSLWKQAVGLSLKKEFIGEEMRLLYVAMTRAGQKLYLIGSTKNDLEKYLSSCESYMAMDGEGYSYVYRSQAAKFMDLIYPAACMNSEHFEIKKVTELPDTEPAQEQVEPEQQEAVSDAYVYPFADEKVLPMKVSVSEIKKKSMLEEYERAGEAAPEWEHGGKAGATDMIKKVSERGADDFAGADNRPAGYSGAQIGTLYHKVCQFLPFDLLADKTEEFLDSLVSRDIITNEEKQYLKPERFKRLLKSTLAKRMAAADTAGMLKREQPFVMGEEAGKLFSEFDGEKRMIPVQGVIDCFFAEEDGLVIVDYKTDHIAPGEEQELARRYTAQLKLYAEAVERALQKPVKERILYSFATGNTVNV